MVHGATFSSVSLFDVAVGGASFMDVLAEAGYDVWAVDARGYGGSTRPPEMSRPPEGGTPLTPARTAVADLGAAVDFVRCHRGVARVGVLGMSWGATVAGAFASIAGDQVEKLVLVTPLWLSGTPLRIDPGGPLGAYRAVDPKAYGAAWRAAAPEHARQALIPDGWFDAWVEATLATDPGSPVAGTVRAPAGAVQDVRDHWTAGKPLYDPAAITCPVLLVCAEWDVDVSPRHGARPVRAVGRRLIQAARRGRPRDSHAPHGTEPAAGVRRSRRVSGGAVRPGIVRRLQPAM